MNLLKFLSVQLGLFSFYNLGLAETFRRRYRCQRGTPKTQLFQASTTNGGDCVDNVDNFIVAFFGIDMHLKSIAESATAAEKD